ncbi:hypothetical protein I3J27_18355 [Bradyrhizobium xenonodulans]|uniref:Uncharacterized protein n=1 Tax=Bradyrhizobium xenonodulans TaxID=2736875 RepID=A0ABY7MV68_9BRAD|nr:hypothetical protein [Bradyrhizobium xenonodulans]WBL82295.1 hypothetical protein I3J27_18355 [Bradyrhizobium xenonodulans]
MIEMKWVTTPEWTTAVATVVQTVAVVATVGVAAIEYFGHKKQDVRTERESVIKLFAEEPAEVQKLRELAFKLAECIKENPEDPSLGTHGCPNPFPSEDEASQQLQPLLAYIGKVSLCRRAGICEIELSNVLYCEDAKNAVVVTQRHPGILVIETAPRKDMIDYTAFYDDCQRVVLRPRPTARMTNERDSSGSVAGAKP